MNLRQLLANTAKSCPSRTAIVSGESRISYGELDETSRRVARALLDLGVREGDRVAMLLPNCPEFVYFYFGIARIRAIPVPLDTRYKIGEMSLVIANCTPKVLVADTPLLKPLVPEVFQFPTIEHTINVDPEFPEQCISYQEMIAGTPSDDVDIEPDPGDLGLISYTSGPSSHPKGSAISHRNLCELAVASGKGFEQTADDVVMMFALPMYHNFALGSLLLTSVHLGSTMVIVPGTGISITSLMEAVERERGTMWIGVPYIFALAVRIAQEEGIKSDLSSLRLCASGGAPLPIDTIEKFRQCYGLTIADVWGLTEGVAHITCPPLDGSGKPGSVGKALPGYELKIIDDAGNELPPNHPGEIIVRGPMMDCYYNNPEATAKAIKGSWLYTGDIGLLDEDKNLFITGRKKSMIILKGQNIYPVDIEEALRTHPKVADARVIGVPDKLRGEVVQAIISLKDNATASDYEIKRFCLERMADFKAPREIIFTGRPPGNQGPGGETSRPSRR